MTQAQVEAVQEISLDKITVHELNPRKDPGDVTELAASIVEHGVIQPVMVVRNNGHFELVHGSRRFAAAKVAGRETIPAIVRDIAEEAIAEIALIENLQRRDLNGLEEARGYKAWLELTKRSQADLARAVGKAPSTIANVLRLLEAPKPVQAALERGDISGAHVKVLLTVPADMLPAVELKKGVTVGDLEEQADHLKRLSTSLTNIRESIEAAKVRGFTATWPKSLWVNGGELELAKFLGAAPASIVGQIGGDDTATHDRVCECRFVGVVDESYGQRAAVRRVCVKRDGWAALASAQRLDRRVDRKAAASGKKPTAAQIVRAKAQRQKDFEQKRAKRQREAIAAATSALKGTAGYAHVTLKVDPKLTKGGLDKEPAREVLFSLVTRMSHAWAPGWRAALWQQIAKMPLKEVRERAVQWAAAGTLSEVGSRADEKTELTRVVFEHYGIAVPEPKAKKKAKR